MPYTQQLNGAFRQLERKNPSYRCATFAPIQLSLILSWADEIYNWQEMQLEPRSSKNQLKYLDQMEAFKFRKDLMSDWQDKTYCHFFKRILFRELNLLLTKIKTENGTYTSG